MARRRTGATIGRALEGFAQGFLPTYFQMKQEDRLKLADRQRFLESAGSKIQKDFTTPAQLETFIDAAVERGDFKTRKEARTALTPYMPTDEQRWAKGWSLLDSDPATWTPTRSQQIMRSVGIEDPFQETFLPSRPRSGSVGLAGAPPPAPDWLPSRTVSAVSGLPGAPPPVDPSGKLLAPLRIGPLQQPPPGIETGPLQVHEPRWGGPQAEMFEKIKAEALEEQRKQAGLLTEFEVGRVSAVTEAQMQAAFDFENNNFKEIQNLHDRTSTEENQRRIDGMIFELEHPRLEPLRQQIEIARLNNAPLNEAQQAYARMMNDVQLEFAVKNHAITAAPQFYYPYNLKTKKVDVYAVTFDQVQGKNVLRALDDLDMPEGVRNMLRGSAPWSSYFQGREQDNSMFRVLTDLGYDRAAAMQFIENMPGGGGGSTDGLPENIDEIRDSTGFNEEDIADDYYPPANLLPNGLWQLSISEGGGGMIGRALGGGLLTHEQLQHHLNEKVRKKIDALMSPLEEEKAKVNQLNLEMQTRGGPPGLRERRNRDLGHRISTANELAKPLYDELASIERFFGVPDVVGRQ